MITDAEIIAALNAFVAKARETDSDIFIRNDDKEIGLSSGEWTIDGHPKLRDCIEAALDAAHKARSI